jgi:8-oxo-dGTP pyrophosphatase MutT (NUDIX family)
MKDYSFGIIPYHKESKRFLIIRHTKDHWSFPKGHREGNETPQQSATRELLEETGLQAESIDTRAFSETYMFTKNDTNIYKTVTYFIGFIENTSVITQEAEIKDFAWLPLDEAVETITFENAQYVLKEASAYLRSKGFFS